MSYSLLEQNTINEINECNRYLEGFFKQVLGDEYDEDASENIGKDLDVENMDQFYFYSIYCWRMFYYLIQNQLSSLDGFTKEYVEKIEVEGDRINKKSAEKNLHKLTFNIARILIVYDLSGGAVGTRIDSDRGGYLTNFYKIQEFAPYISRVLRHHKIGNNFNYLSYYFSYKFIDDAIKNTNIKETFETINHINNNEVNLSNMIKNQKDLKNEINAIEKRLEGYKGEYNFVELSSAFTKIKLNKTKEQGKSTRNYWVCMFTLMFFPILVIWSHWGKTSFDWSDLFFYVPMVTLEILFLYFMRLFYVETKNINSQILQIDLRLSLCEFIQGYVRYRKENTDSEDVLKTFEALIFSPIQATGDNIPSVLDGANVLAELAGNIMKAKEK